MALERAALGPRRALADALDTHADEVFDELDPDQQATAEVLFRALTERAEGERDTRRLVKTLKVADVAGVSPDRVIACTQPFRRADHNFLTPPAGQPLGADDTIDITHEVLVRQWKRLRDWTDDEAEQAEFYQHLAASAITWIGGTSTSTDPATPGSHATAGILRWR